jgi:hypothetical protein
VAYLLGAEPPEYRRRLIIDGVLFDVAHHITLAGRRYAWTESGSANRLVAEFLVEAGRRGERVPDIVIRGHGHLPIDSGAATKPRALFLPGWQLMTENVHRSGTVRVAPVGGVAIKVGGGQIRGIEWQIYYPDPVPEEVLL